MLKFFRQGNYTINRLIHFCRDYFGQETRSTFSAPCCECDAHVQIFSKKAGGVRTTIAIDHACVHWGTPLYACGHCDYKFSTKQATFAHLVQKHRLLSTPENYLDNSSAHEQEIMDMIKRCFKTEQNTIQAAAKTIC